jgi:putative transposase
MNEEDRIAVFRYGLIAPVINDNSLNQAQYFKRIARIEYEYPGKVDKVRFSFRTFKKWLHLYRRYGYEGLKPSTRKDKGISRKIKGDIQGKIKELCNDYDFKTISNLYRYLITEKIIEPEIFTEVTLRNFLKANKIRFDSMEKKPRKSFEAPHINILWTTDFMHGPYVRTGKKKIKSYLCAIIDDYSRVITGAAFYLSESSLSLEKTLKDAVLTYCIPQKLYCDYAEEKTMPKNREKCQNIYIFGKNFGIVFVRIYIAYLNTSSLSKVYSCQQD